MCDRIKINYRGWLLVTNFLAFLFHLCLPPATFKGGFCTGQFHYLEFESKMGKEEKKRYIDSSQGKRFSGGLWDGLAALTVWEKVDGNKEVLYPLHHVWQVQVETFVNSNSLLPNLHQIPHWENDTEDCFKNSLFYFSGDSAISDHRKCHMLVSVFLPRNSFSEFLYVHNLYWRNNRPKIYCTWGHFFQCNVTLKEFHSEYNARKIFL